MKKIAEVIKLKRDSTAWRDALPQSKDTRKPKANLLSAAIALEHAPEWQGVLAYDEFALTAVLMKPPPWWRKNGEWGQSSWSDADDNRATVWLQQNGIDVKPTTTAQAADTVARKKTFHPIRDYFAKIEPLWDGRPRALNFLADYMGAERSTYSSDVSRVLFVGAVARILRPGCKHDQMPILESEQGAGKSRALDVLFSPWYTDDIAELGSKDSQMQARSAWGIEVAELSAMARSDVERIKAFLSVA
jgi:predicted P-loop ATPase